MKVLKLLLAICILYFYIYSPALQVLPIGFDKIIFFVFLVFYIFNKKECSICLRLFNKDYNFLLAIFGISLLEYLIHSGAYGYGTIMYDFFMLIEPILVGCCLYVLLEEMWKVDIKSIIYVTAGSAGLITVYLLLNPNFAFYIKTQILRVPEIITTYFDYRGFGFADGLLNPYPTAQGLILGLLICGFFKNKNYYYILAIPIFVSILVNARTGIIPVILGLILFVFFKTDQNRTKDMFAAAILIISSLTLINSNISYTDAEKSLEWGGTIWMIFLDLLSGKEAENTAALTGSMLFFPDNIGDWLFGGGFNVYDKNPLNKHSDIGYIIRLHYGGLFYLTLLIAYILFMSRRLWVINKPIALLMLLSFAIFNYKGNFFVMSPCSRLFFLVYVIMICNAYRKRGVYINLISRKHYENNI